MDRGMYIFCMVIVFSLVIGGDRTVEAQNSQKNNGSSPWMAALGYQEFTMSYAKYAFLCGGSLISDKYVLTAATCTTDLGVYHLAIVRLGYSNLDPNVNDESEPIDVEISRVITHREYSKQKFTNDIALLELKNTVVFNHFIQPICLPILSHHRAKTFVKSELFVTSFNFRLPEPRRDAPMEFEVRVVDNSECQQKYNTSNIVINEKHLCAESTGLVPEQGISGSPLIWASGTQYYVVGVLNFGSNIQGAGYPDGYARVTSFVEWIADNMKYS